MSIRGNWLLHKMKRENLKRGVEKSFRNPNRREDELAPAKFADDFVVTEDHLETGRLVHVTTKTPSRYHLIFLHGGAFTVRGTESHRQLIELIARASNAQVTYFDFPLTPEHTAAETVTFTVAAYLDLVEQYPNDHFVLFGDSAGAGLALVLLTQLRDQSARLPENTLLVSPWVDLQMADSKLDDAEAEDPELPLDALRDTAEIYAGAGSLKDPTISPIYADLSHLGAIGVFYGTTELLVSDTKKLIAKLQQSAGTTVQSYALHNMMHDYILWTKLPETKRTLARLTDLLTD